MAPRDYRSWTRRLVWLRDRLGRFWAGVVLLFQEEPTSITGRSVPVESAQRAARRLELQASCRPITSLRDDPWTGEVRDLATDRIGLVLSRRFEPGTILTIEVANPTQTVSHTLLGRVMHATPSRPGSFWLVGCALANKLAEDELEALAEER